MFKSRLGDQLNVPSSENPRVGVDIGPEVLNFARHQEDGGHQEVQLGGAGVQTLSARYSEDLAAGDCDCI